nr:unnamed protein product [Callosobruchus chinensis]
MHPRNFFFSPQGGRSSHIKNRTIRLHLCPKGVQNFFFSPQGGRFSYIKNRMVRPHLCPQCVQGLEWTGLVMYLLSRRLLEY